MGQVIQHRLHVNERECDAAGFALKASYVAYVEAVVARLWETALEGWPALAEAGFALDLSEVRVCYLGEAELDQELELEARVVGLEEAAITTEVAATVNGRAVASARAQHLLVNASSRNPAAVQAYIEAALGPYLHEHHESIGFATRVP